MKNLINNLHQSKFLGRVVHTLDYCLQRELADCESVLDLGCGPDSPLQYCKNIKKSVGVEAFKPYMEESRSKRIHTEYLEKKIEIYQKNDIKVYLGGTLFEAFVIRNKFEEFTGYKPTTKKVSQLK